MGTGKDTYLRGLDSRPSEPTTSPAKATPGSSHSADVELELERLRAERDAMAAELQIERAERLRAEERLRLLEREKLEQMRQGAASREKLASELEEARLRAMRAEGRQAAFEADARLAEIEERRRGARAGDSELGPLASEVAEPAVEEPAPDEAPDDEPEKMDPAPARSGRSFSRSQTPAREDRRSASSASSAPRRPAAAEPDPLPTSRLRGPQTAPRRPDERGPGARPQPAKPGSPGGGAGAASGARRGADHAAKGGEAAGAKGSAPTSAKGGAAAGRPSIDRARLEARLTAGAVIKTTDRFRQFQPVAQSHIKVCDWLAQAKTLAEIETLAAGEVAASEILNVLVLFFERSFLVLEQS
jgi:hypothetical protein